MMVIYYYRKINKKKKSVKLNYLRYSQGFINRISVIIIITITNIRYIVTHLLPMEAYG